MPSAKIWQGIPIKLNGTSQGGGRSATGSPAGQEINRNEALGASASLTEHIRYWTPDE